MIFIKSHIIIFLTEHKASDPVNFISLSELKASKVPTNAHSNSPLHATK